MPDTGAPWNIPYVAGTDLVSDWPTDSQTLATAIADGLDAANLGIGTNVVQTVKTDTFSTTSSSFTPVTGLSATTTPSSATSLILVVSDVKISSSAVANLSAHLRIAGGNAGNYVGDAASSRIQSASSWTYNSTGLEFAQSPVPTFAFYLDAPATASSVTYSIEVCRGSTSGTVWVNKANMDSDSANTARTASSLTVIEVAP